MTEVRAARLKTFKTDNGSSIRIETAPAQQLRCPDEHMWFKAFLQSRHLKAYNPDVSVNDPKNRKAANEIDDWCAGATIMSCLKPRKNLAPQH
jgi:hypothetical protein